MNIPNMCNKQNYAVDLYLMGHATFISYIVLNEDRWHHTTIKIVRLSVTIGDRGKQRAARGWAVELRVFKHAHVSMITYPCRRLPKWANRRIPTLPGWPRVSLF